MTAADDLEAIANDMADILSRFTKSRDSINIGDGDQAKFTGLVLEARELLNGGLGAANNFGLQLEFTRADGVRNFVGSQSYHSVEQAAGIVRSAAKALRRKLAAPNHPSSGTQAATPYVSLTRIDELRGIASTKWDLRRLVRLCEELNAAFSGGNFLSVAMILRAVADHVPPIFGAKSFGEYASSIVRRSHKGSMEHLQGSLRHIADSVLHDQVRQKESLPTNSQVDFRQDLDVLLGEVVRTLG
ncbi:hypothetical protein [Aminobacter sp. BE322]|uniref:hypothetical protein n=1 Tax=unclassified Aminobacter TaxID=2644704 RepID=UPI003D2504E5